MNAERVEQLFIEAIHLPPSERINFLENACANDREMLGKLRSMLEAHGRAETLEFFAPRSLPAGIEATDQRIGPYALREQLGEGGWGVVFLAEQEKPVRRRVALKVIKAGLDTRNVIARFEAERQALARMDHPNIAKVLDAGATETGRPYFVMELVSGPRLTDYCNEKKLRVIDRLELFIKVCQAVQHAHQKGIIHRDLKPSNILVADHDPEQIGIPKVIDFGIAKATEGRLTDYTAYTGGPHLLGTPAYMSPEQTITPNPDVDTRSDIYSLGVILYELLAGRTPFDSKKLLESGWEELCHIIREKDPLRPSALLAALSENEQATIAHERGTDPAQLARQVNGDLDWIVIKCLAKERGRRYETANGLAADLKRHLANEPVTARPPSATYRLRKSIRRNKLVFSTAAVIAGVLLLGTVVSTWQAIRASRAERKATDLRGEADQQRQWAELNVYAADMYSAARDLEAGNRGHATQLLRHYRPRAGLPDPRGWEWRYLLKRSQTRELFTLTGHKGYVHTLVFSPDSKTLFSGDTDGVVKSWDLFSRKETGMVSIGRLIYGMAVSTNGKALILGWADGVAIYDGPSFTRVKKLPGAKGPLALSPDGRTLVTGGTNGVTIWDAATWEKLHSDTSIIPGRTQIGFSPDGSMIALSLLKDEIFQVEVRDTAILREMGFEAPPLSVLSRNADTNQNNPRAVQPHYPPVTAVVFSRNSEILATGQLLTSGQQGVQFWNPRTGLPLSPPQSRFEVLNMAFLSDSRTLVTYNRQQDFYLWDITSRTNIAFQRSFSGHENEIWSMAVAPDDRIVASGSKEGIIKIWPTEAFLEVSEKKDRIDAPGIGEIGFSQDGQRMFTLSTTSTITSWDTGTWQARDSYDLPRKLIVGRISPQGTHLALGLTHGGVEIWQIAGPDESPRLSRELLPAQPTCYEPFFITVRKDAEQSPVSPLMTWSGDGKKLSVFLHDLHVWDADTGISEAILPLEDKPDALALSPDGSMLAAASGPKIQLWDMRVDRLIKSWEAHGQSATELSFSPDGKILASSSFDNTAALWEVPSGKLRSRLTSHTFSISHLAFSPDGHTLATRGADHSVRLWHVETGRELMVLGNLDSDWDAEFEGVKFSLDGTKMAVGLSSGQIRFFEAPPLEDLDAVEFHWQ